MVGVNRRGSAQETKEETQGQEEEVEEDKYVSSDKALPIYPGFEYEVKYEQDKYRYRTP